MSQKSKLPADLKRMLHTAKKYNVHIDTLTKSKETSQHGIAEEQRNHQEDS